MSDVVMNVKGVRKEFFRKTRQSARNFDAVAQTDLALFSGDVVACTGRSGSGKTTLLNMMAGLLAPTEGSVEVCGHNLYALSDAELSKVRNELIGVIPQGQTPIQSLTLLQNVLLPLQMYQTHANAEQDAMQILEALHIAHLADSYPGELSGGELRRMAVARALITNPKVVLADEPTGDLDDETTNDVLQVLSDVAGKGAAVFMVTHDALALPFATRKVHMQAGEVVEEN